LENTDGTPVIIPVEPSTDPDPYYDDYGGGDSYWEYIVSTILGIIIMPFMGIWFLFSEYYVEIGIMAGISLMIFTIVFWIGVAIGSAYLFFYFLEQVNAIEENPVDYFIYVTLDEWMTSIGMFDWIRIPLIWFEY